jgi:muramoyltetrapeptide carboxypeptidase
MATMNSNNDHNASRPLLKPGGTIGIAAPASGADHGALQNATTWLQSKGYSVREADNVYTQDRYLAGNDETRAAAMMELFSDPAIDAIFTARGAYGSMRILDKIDYDLIAGNPKPFIGFSDTTSLQLAILSSAGLVSYSGMALATDFEQTEPHPATAASLWALLQGKPLQIEGMTTVHEGETTGPLIGGCLSLITTLLGTPFLPDMEGALLFLEDVGEEPYHVDRMLTHLRLSGTFDKVGAVLLGTFSKCVARNPRDGVVEDVLKGIADWTDAPVVTGLPYGHHQGRHILPIGEQVGLTAHADGSATLTIPGGSPASATAVQ